MNYIDICRKQLPIDEGVRKTPYKDSVGIPTIGIGRNLEKGLSDAEIAFLLENDIVQADIDARALCPSFDSLSEPRKAVLVNMSFNLGKSRLAGFVKMLAAIADGKFDEAADQMKSSKWYVQVGERGKRLEKAMREG
jgi:lysozyme